MSNTESPSYFPKKKVAGLTADQAKSAENILERIRYQLGNEKPFYSAILYNLNCKAHKTDDGLAWITPFDINFTFDNITDENAFGPEGSFFKLSKMGSQGMIKMKNVVIHEILHLVMGHFNTPKQYIHELCNIAMDAELHKIMQMDGLRKEEMPKGCVWPDTRNNTISLPGMGGDCPCPDLANKTWDQIYWDVLKFMQDKCKQQNKSMEELIAGMIGAGLTIDVPSQGDSEDEEAAGGGFGDGIGSIQDRIDALDQIIKSAFMRTKSVGKCPAGLDRYVNEFGHSKVPWQEKFRHLLRQKPFVERIENRPNSKLFHITGIPVMPRFVGERMDNMWLFFDTSGSIQPEDIQEGVNEIHALRQTSNAELFVSSCDTRVYDIVKFDIYDYPEADQLPIQGGGGTDFRPIFEKVQEYIDEGKCDLPSVLVLVTDTYGAFPEQSPGYPVIALIPSTISGYWGNQSAEDHFRVPEWCDLVLIENERKK